MMMTVVSFVWLLLLLLSFQVAATTKVPTTSRLLGKCPPTATYKYKIKATISNSYIGGCDIHEAKAIGKVIDDKIRHVFDTEDIIYDSYNKVNHNPTKSRRRLVLDPRRELPLRPLATRHDFAELEELEIEIGHRSLSNKGNYVYNGGGRCRACNYDDDDATRRRRRRQLDDSWDWIKTNMEPILSQECSNAVNNKFRNKGGHCLQNKITKVTVKLIRTR